MTSPTMSEKKVHHGRNVKRIREMLGIKQETLASELNMSQQNISVLENKEEIETELMEQIARVLNIPTEAIRNFDEMAAVNIISNTFHDFKDNSVANANYCTFNPIDKIIELYDALLKEKDEKNALLERLLKEKK